MSRYIHLPKDQTKGSNIQLELIRAIYEPNEALFDLLIKSVKDLDAPLGTGRGKWAPLMFAIHKRRSSMVKKLLELGANPFCYDRSTLKTGLHTACVQGYYNIVHLLLATKKLDINDNHNEEGETPLFLATKKNHAGCVRLLLDNHLHHKICNVNVQLKANGQTPLIIAADKGDAEIVRLLLHYNGMKCNINLTDNRGYTPLMKAVSKGHTDIVDMLLSRDPSVNPHGFADPTMTNRYGICAAVMAIRTHNYHLAKKIIAIPENDGIIWRKDWKGRTILDHCNATCDNEIVNTIKGRLYEQIEIAMKQVNQLQQFQHLPFVPPGLVRYICEMTY